MFLKELRRPTRRRRLLIKEDWEMEASHHAPDEASEGEGGKQPFPPDLPLADGTHGDPRGGSLVHHASSASGRRPLPGGLGHAPGRSSGAEFPHDRRRRGWFGHPTRDGSRSRGERHRRWNVTCRSGGIGRNWFRGGDDLRRSWSRCWEARRDRKRGVGEGRSWCSGGSPCLGRGRGLNGSETGNWLRRFGGKWQSGFGKWMRGNFRGTGRKSGHGYRLKPD